LINCEQALNISTTNAALQTDLDSLTCSNFLRFLAACGKIHKFLRRLAVRFSTSCGFLRLDFQLLAFQKFLRVNRKNMSFLLLAAACAFLRHFLCVHYFGAVLYGLFFILFNFETFSTAVEWVAHNKLKIDFILHLLDDFLLVALLRNSVNSS